MIDDFNIFDIRAITNFKQLKPVSGDSFEAFEYKTALYLYDRVSLRFETIFRRINELFIKNNKSFTKIEYAFIIHIYVINLINN